MNARKRSQRNPRTNICLLKQIIHLRLIASSSSDVYRYEQHEERIKQIFVKSNMFLAFLSQPSINFYRKNSEKIVKCFRFVNKEANKKSCLQNSWNYVRRKTSLLLTCLEIAMLRKGFFIFISQLPRWITKISLFS